MSCQSSNGCLDVRNAKPGLLLRLLLLLIAVLTWSDFGVRVLLPAVQAPHWPNPAYWVAARLAVEGNADLIYADRDVFFQQAARLGTVPDIFEANMPTTILVFLPLAAFSETTARTIWDVAMLLCYILACALLFRALAPTRTIEIGLWALAPVFHPWRENISRGQAYPLLFLLLVVGAMLGFKSHYTQVGTDAGAPASTPVSRRCGSRTVRRCEALLCRLPTASCPTLEALAPTDCGPCVLCRLGWSYRCPLGDRAVGSGAWVRRYLARPA